MALAFCRGNDAFVGDLAGLTFVCHSSDWRRDSHDNSFSFWLYISAFDKSGLFGADFGAQRANQKNGAENRRIFKGIKRLKEQKMISLASVIVLNLNGKKFLEICLESLERQTYKNFEVILVDNGSSDDSVDFVKKKYPDVKIIKNKKNLGFAEANNQGFEISKGEYIVVLNNDTRVEKYWLENLVKGAEKDEKIGMVASKILLMNSQKEIDSVGVNLCLDGMSRQRGRCEVDKGQYNKSEEVLFPSACAALYKRKMIEEVGFFDEDFFAYCEDSDLGLRGRLAGWKAVLAPGAVVHHHYSGTAGKYSSFKVYLVERNHTWFCMKNFPAELLLLFPFFTFYRFFLQFVSVLIKKGSIRR